MDTPSRILSKRHLLTHNFPQKQDKHSSRFQFTLETNQHLLNLKKFLSKSRCPKSISAELEYPASTFPYPFRIETGNPKAFKYLFLSLKAKPKILQRLKIRLAG
jgi:hypothetical protein